jgi:hypothetical protein
MIASVTDPIHLAWMVKKAGKLTRTFGRMRPHAACPRGESGYAAVFEAAPTHSLLHHPDKLDGVESAAVYSFSRSALFTTRTSRMGSASNRPRYRGTALILVLVGLAVTTLIFMAAIKMILIQRKTIELNSRQIQARWLAESGVERAAARLAADAKYEGETWNISAQELGGRDGGKVNIKVEEVPDKPDHRKVHIEADYPTEPELRARETRDVTLRTGEKP